MEYLRFVMVLFLAVPASSMLAQENKVEPINLLAGLKPQLTSVESATNGISFNLAANGAAVKYSLKANLGNPLEFLTNTATLSFRAGGDGVLKVRIGVTGFDPYDIAWTLPPQSLTCTAIWPPPGKKIPRTPGDENVEITIQTAQGSVALIEQVAFRVQNAQKPKDAGGAEIDALLEGNKTAGAKKDEPEKARTRQAG